MKYVQIIGGILLLVGVLTQVSRWELSPYIYTVGAILFGYVQVSDRYEGRSIVIRRLRRQQIIGATLLAATGPCMIFLKYNQWIICFTIAAILECYTIFRVDHEMRHDS